MTYEECKESMATAEAAATNDSAGDDGVGNCLYYKTTALNEDASYVIFNSYHECAVIGVLPLIALSFLNYNIYVKIRKSASLNHRLGPVHTGEVFQWISVQLHFKNQFLTHN